MKKTVSFIVVDDQTGSPVADTQVTVRDRVLKTDSNGAISVNSVPVGKTIVTFIKPFYDDKTEAIQVPIIKSNSQQKVVMHALGKLVTATVRNRLSGRPVVGALVAVVGGGQGVADEQGIARFIIASGANTASVTITGAGINETTATVRAAQDVQTNILLTTPAGKVYFLSKQSGSVDVVKSNLDGTDRQTVVAGTGREDPNNTTLVASKDWQFLALKARRDTESPRLYMIDTKTDILVPIDQTDKLFTVVGWSGSNFIYRTDIPGANAWTPKKSALLSFNAGARLPILLDETKAEGGSILDYASEYFGDTFLKNSGITYTKYWGASYYYGTRLANKRISVTLVSADGSTKKVIKEWQAGYNSLIRSVLSGPDQAYYFVELDGVQRSYWVLSGNKISESTDLSSESLSAAKYSSYIPSPNGKNTFWNEQIDGKKSLFIADQEAKNAKQIASLSDFVAYGWYTDDYLLVSKNSSELYVMGRDGIKPGDVPTKITDFQKSSTVGRSYGYGSF